MSNIPGGGNGNRGSLMLYKFYVETHECRIQMSLLVVQLGDYLGQQLYSTGRIVAQLLWIGQVKETKLMFEKNLMNSYKILLLLEFLLK